MAADHHSESELSLGSPKFSGGPRALEGFDFQRAYALKLLVESLPDPEFSALLCEGAEDVETRFDRDGTVERYAVQVKAYRVNLFQAREIVRRFQNLDKDSPGTWKSFAIACPDLDGTLQSIHDLLTDYRRSHGFYDDKNDEIPISTHADLERRLVKARLPAQFVIQRVRFETGLPDSAKLTEYVRLRVLDTLLSSYPGADYATAKGIYFQLVSLVSESTRKPITRQQVESVIEAAISPMDSSAPTCVSAPAPPHRFIGRRDYIAALINALTTGDGAARIAIQGMGGVGKTATALKLATELHPRFPGGVFWGALPDHDGNPRPILRHWAQSCGGEIPSRVDLNTLADSVRDLMMDRQTESGSLLIFIDDVRSEWLDAAQVLKRAIPAESSLLLTTRDEQLAVALGTDVHRLDTLHARESLALLKSHASAATIDADLVEATALLEAVGHLPLAIELAGKCLALLAHKLGNRLYALRQAIEERAAHVLTLPGYPSLAATFDITYEALPEEAQRLFRWLGTFASSPLRIAAVAGIMGWDEIGTESALDEFVWLSMLKWDKTVSAYMMHPLLRQYAQARLAEAGEADEAGQRHVAYYVVSAQANAQAEPGAWDRQEEQLPNLLLAAQRAAKASDSASMVCLEEALLHDSRFLYVRGYYQETIALLSQSLAVQETASEQQYQPRTLNKMAFFYSRLGKSEKAQEHAEAARLLAISLNDREQQADSLHYLGIISEEQGESELALGHFREELEIRRELGDLARLANCLSSLEAVQELLGNYDQARRHLDEGLSIYEKINEPDGIARCTINRGILSLYLGEYACALKDFEAALDQSIDLEYREGIALSLVNRGILQSYRGDYSRSLQSLKDSLSLWQRIGYKAGESLAHSTLAEVYAALGDRSQAGEHLQITDEQIQGVDNKVLEVQYLNARGVVHHELGDYQRALEDYRRLEALAENTGARYFVVQGQLGLSRALLAQGNEQDLGKIQQYAEKAIILCQELKLAGNEPRGHAYLAKVNLLLGDTEAALQRSHEAMHLLERQERIHGSEAEVYLIATQVLAANGREDERQYRLQQAYELVQATAGTIEDETLRQSYLTLPINREILDAEDASIQAKPPEGGNSGEK